MNNQEKILGLLTAEKQHLDLLQQRSGLDRYETIEALVCLEIKRKALRLPGDCYIKRPENWGKVK